MKGKSTLLIIIALRQIIPIVHIFDLCNNSYKMFLQLHHNFSHMDFSQLKNKPSWAENNNTFWI